MLLVAIALVMILGILLLHQVRVNGLVLRDIQQRLSMAEVGMVDKSIQNSSGAWWGVGG